MFKIPLLNMHSKTVPYNLKMKQALSQLCNNACFYKIIND